MTTNDYTDGINPTSELAKKIRKQLDYIDADPELLDLTNDAIWSSSTVRDAYREVSRLFCREFGTNTSRRAVGRFLAVRLGIQQAQLKDRWNDCPNDIAVERISDA